MPNQTDLRQRILEDERGRMLHDAMEELRKDVGILWMAHRDRRYDFDRCKSVAVASYQILGEILNDIGAEKTDA